MKRLQFYVNRAKAKVGDRLDELVAMARSFGFNTVESGGDVIVSLGGDGTFLRAVREFAGIPVLGLNLGGLGYLATVEERDFSAALGKLASGHYCIAERSVLSVARAGDEVGAANALNDIVVKGGISGHAVRFDLSVDGHAATKYMADGLVIATPTGSTAYSLAAGGPVVMPDTESFVITPMIPHALGVRPMVVRDSSVITVTPRQRDDGFFEPLEVYADGGHVFSLAAGDSAVLRRSERSAPIIELEGYDPYETLARKLGWSGSNVK